jgi:hypothetical protein
MTDSPRLWTAVPIGLIVGLLISNWIDYDKCSARHSDCCYSLKSDVFREPFYHPRGKDCKDQRR